MINGNDLIRRGYTPGAWFGDAIQYANDNSLSGIELDLYLGSVCPPTPEVVRPHDTPVTYHKNIAAETDEDQGNIESVFRTMDALMRTPTLVAGAVMPDACPTGELGQIPVGGVAVARNAIHPAMHSADVCCSVFVSFFSGDTDCKALLDAAQAVTHFGPGGRQDAPPVKRELMHRITSNRFLSGQKSVGMARSHMGTQGDGNHFLFVGRSEETGRVAMVTHHGSRGFGANLYKSGMKVAESYRRELSPDTMKRNAWIPFDTDDGAEYWEALQIVREWTKENHAAIHHMTANKLRSGVLGGFWNEHNFVFRDGDLFYHAKGATPLSDKFVPDSTLGLRLVPLNMAQPVLVVRGDATETNLGFAPHGAGRNVSRTTHKRSLGGEPKEIVFARETAGIDVRFFSGNIDVTELPSAYKDANAVRRQMQEFGLGRVVDRIMPYGCIMAGDWQRDAPWRTKNR